MKIMIVYQLFFRLSLRRRYEKILFSDIDGTIAKDNLPITYKDQEAVKKLRTQGHYFSFVQEEIFRNKTCHTTF